jgi:hypothetical protein
MVERSPLAEFESSDESEAFYPLVKGEVAVTLGGGNHCFRPSTVGRNMQKNFRKADTESR